MATPTSSADIPPAAADVVTRLTATEPVKLLVYGGLGTGKTSTLEAIRQMLRDAGRPVVTRPPTDGSRAAAIVVDDADLLTDTELTHLAEHAGDPDATVVVAALPLTHHPGLRAVVAALEREARPVSLGPLTSAQLADAAGRGAPGATGLVASLTAATAGLPFLVAPALAAADESEGDYPAAVAAAARIALIERLRRVDDAVLDTLLLSSLSSDLGADDIAAALQTGPDDARALVDRARATGLIEPSHTQAFLRLVHSCVVSVTGTVRHHDLELSLLTSQLQTSTLSIDLAMRLAEHGMRDERLAAALAEFAARAGGNPGQAAMLYRAAAEAGATAMSVQLADALALTGDCPTAARIADELLSSTDTAERAAAVRISASVAAHDGSAGQAADLFRWLGPYPDDFVAAASTVVSLAAGDSATARSALSAASAGPPTTTARAARSLAEGLMLTLDQPFGTAVARLSQSVVAEQHSPGVSPDTPAALVTLAAVHGGDPVRARSVIGRTVRSTDEHAFAAHRHRLLLGWVKMQDGLLSSAAADIAPVTDAVLHRRDALWSAALQTAIARRSGDAGGVQKHWTAATEVLSEYSIDLFALLPLGELWVASARLGLIERLNPVLAEAFALLERLGRPTLWSVPLHWAGVHAGILSNDPAAVAPHGQALTAAAAHSDFARALAHAGRTWLRVLAKQVDIGEVTVAARSLAQFGLAWDATRLAGHAALQAPDGRVSGAMLQLARDLKMTVAADEVPAKAQSSATATRDTGGQRPISARLSDREHEVAELLLLGMPYRDIGNQLFISAKTVEHHVARIRRRLGAESRSEMLSMLRAMLASPD